MWADAPVDEAVSSAAAARAAPAASRAKTAKIMPERIPSSVPIVIIEVLFCEGVVEVEEEEGVTSVSRSAAADRTRSSRRNTSSAGNAKGFTETGSAPRHPPPQRSPRWPLDAKKS